MESSDEEGEIVPDCITNYHFVNCKEEPTSFSILPLQWSEDEIRDGLTTQIFLHGTADDGLQKIYKKVIAWKFELSYVLPEIYVLSKDKTWIKLQKPRKSFEDTVKRILVTVHCLHFVKKNPDAFGDALWNHLLKAFSSYEVRPSENDLLDNMALINEAAIRDKDIAKSKYLACFLLEMPGKRKASDEQENRTIKKSKFIVDPDVDDDDDDECDENEDELFDSVCSLCDNGGELLCCEGRCMRSFHATVDAGADSFCKSLGYFDAQVEAIQNFLCKNCQYQLHQCFVCGVLGSSNKSSNQSSGAEVFPCVSATCGHFYHPKCVAKLLHPSDEIQAEKLPKKIASGESFTCPAHKCFVCKQGENKKVFDLQFAMCRRCPKAYHRKCLPRKIGFECNFDRSIHQRAWDGLLRNRILIYCMDHKIIPELGTPERNHILFPCVNGKKKQHISVLLSNKEKLVAEKRCMVSGNVSERIAVKMQKQVEKAYSAVKGGDSTNKIEKGFSRKSFEPKIKETTVKSFRDNNKSVSAKVSNSMADKSKLVLRNEQSNSQLSMRSYQCKPKQKNIYCGKTENAIAAENVKKKVSSSRPLIDAETEKRIVALMENSTSSFKLEEFIKDQKRLSGYAHSSKFVVDKTITEGRVEGSVQAVRTALKKLEEGCTIEDAKAVCEPEILNQITRWKGKLKVYLAPFLHGMRYTSFGRHFTKVDKLKEVVERLHWYVQNGDMIVDFCCGSNDFSCLMKEKLDKMGKRCSFINYDLIQPKNDFNFEKRDWMSVRVGELPTGSRLIMGLNPPFGVHASLANKFIDKALKFKPKLLILIVPKETKRLDEKEPPYDIIWEDDEILSGKSFYLPGSVDVHDQQMEQWNWDPPPLYLWSRPDWTANHKAIAQKHGHLSKKQEEMHAEGSNVEIVVSNYLMEENRDCYGDFSNIINGYGDISSILDDVPEDPDHVETEGTRAIAPDEQENQRSLSDGSCEGLNNDNHRNKLSSEDLDEMQHKEKLDIWQSETSLMENLDVGGLLQTDEMYIDMELSTPTNSPIKYTDEQILFEDKSFEALDIPSEMNTEAGFWHLQPSISGHPLEFGKENARFHTNVPNAMDNGCGQLSEAFPSGTFNNQFSAHEYDNVENFDQKSNGWLLE
uniref:Zinc finger PHD-type domain-containing protein n=1 Tax=Davidia involucrata TaxID=16924 RepID=A0A5B7BBL9_DAVIN